MVFSTDDWINRLGFVSQDIFLQTVWEEISIHQETDSNSNSPAQWNLCEEVRIYPE